MIYFELFITFFKIGLFSFGGGYGMLPLIEQEAVGHGWITDSEFLNFLAVAESTPGPISINMATFIGSTQLGIGGSLLCTLGTIMPSIIIILIIVVFLKNFLKYNSVKSVMSGIKPVIAGLILTTGLFLALKNFLPNATSFSTSGINWKALVLMLCLGTVAFVYKKFRKKALSPIILIVVSAVVGILIF